MMHCVFEGFAAIKDETHLRVSIIYRPQESNAKATAGFFRLFLLFGCARNERMDAGSGQQPAVSYWE